MEIKEKIIEIIARVLEKDVNEVINQMNESGNLEDIGMNSISFIKCTIEIEDEYEIEFDFEALDNDYISNLDQLCEYVNKKVKELE